VHVAIWFAQQLMIDRFLLFCVRMEFLGVSGWFVGVEESEGVLHEEELEFLEQLPLTALTAFKMSVLFRLLLVHTWPNQNPPRLPWLARFIVYRTSNSSRTILTRPTLITPKHPPNDPYGLPTQLSPPRSDHSRDQQQQETSILRELSVSLRSFKMAAIQKLKRNLRNHQIHSNMQMMHSRVCNL
jgi:hypothetical protein